MTRRGVIAAGDRQTAEAGAELMRAGGNAVDAVVAAGFASFVCEPPLTSPAGAGALLHGDPGSGFTLLDFFAATPGIGLQHRPALDFHQVFVSFGSTSQAFHVGRGAAAVPGALKGLLEAHRGAGSLPLAEVVAPAVHLARSGWVLSAQIRTILGILEAILTLTPGISALTYADGELPPEHSVLTNRPLADFLEALGRNPPAALRAFDEGLLDTCGPANGGLLTRADLERYAPVRRDPLRTRLATRTGSFEVLTNPPPSSGGGLISFGLKLAAAAGLADRGWLGPEHVATVARVLRATSLLRGSGYDAHIHDRDAIEAMLADTHVATYAGRVRPEHPLGSTTHVSVLDARGGAASLTTSNGEGCGHVLEGLGIHVNNFLGEEDINPLGFHRAAPGSWMSTMMAPSVVLEDGAPRLVLGSGGSNRIRSVVLQALLASLVMERPLAEAVSAPRLHVDGEQLWFEGGLPEASARALLGEWEGAIGFPDTNMFFGGVHSVGLDDEGLVGVGDARRGGAVAWA